LGNLAIGIIEVTKHPHPCHAGRHAGRFFTLLDKFDAEPAFLNITFFFDDPHVIRTGRNAIFATNAFIFIHQDYSVLSLMRGSCGTDLDAGSIITMLALNGQELTCIIGKMTIFPLFEVIEASFSARLFWLWQATRQA